MRPESLDGRVVAITGGAGGIGRALGRAFYDAGARVALLDLDTPALATAAASPEVALVVPCDVTDPEACQAAVDQVQAELGGLDVLVANAGISHLSRFAQTRLSVFRQVVDVNLMGAVHCTQAALPALVRARGWIVVTSSVAGFAPLVDRTAYAASKHALHGLFDTLRTELVDQGVTVLLACPTFTATDILAHALDGTGAVRGGTSDVHRRGLHPDDVAQEIVGAVRRRRSRVLVGRTARLAWWVSRIAPGVYARLMLRSQAGHSGT